MSTSIRNLRSPWALSRIFAGSFQDVTMIRFRGLRRDYLARVPSIELWTAVKDVLVFEEYDDYPSFHLTELPVGATIVDAGAFVGLYSLKVSERAGRVISLEPSAESFPLLLENIRVNGVNNVDARNVAIRSEPGEVYFIERGTVSHVAAGRAARPCGHLARATSINELVRELGHIDMLKMDIEGSEYSTILGAEPDDMRCIDRIAAELHVDEGGGFQQVRNLVQALQRAGLEVTLLDTPAGDWGHVIAKPWLCSLQGFKDRTSLIFRAYLCAVYSLKPLLRPLKGSLEAGPTLLLYAVRASAAKIRPNPKSDLLTHP